MTEYTDEQILTFLRYRRAIGEEILFVTYTGRSFLGQALRVLVDEDRAAAEVPPDSSGIDWADPEARKAVGQFLQRNGWMGLPNDL